MNKAKVDLYRQGLEIDIITALARKRKASIRDAADVYYRSRLCSQVATGLYGIDNLDADYLADDLIENEPELFR